jgi:hypothetical protein
MKPKDLINLINSAKDEKDAKRAEDVFKMYFVGYSETDKKETLGRLAIGEYSMNTIDKTKAFIDKVVSIAPSNVVIEELGTLYCTLIAMVYLSKIMAEYYKDVPTNEIDYKMLDKAFPNGETLFVVGKEMFDEIGPAFSQKLKTIVENAIRSEESIDKNNQEPTN